MGRIGKKVKLSKVFEVVVVIVIDKEEEKEEEGLLSFQ